MDTMITVRRPTTYNPTRLPYKPIFRARTPVARVPPVRASSLETSVRIFGDAVFYFTFFYCTFNWLHYKRINDARERHDREWDKQGNEGNGKNKNIGKNAKDLGAKKLDIGTGKRDM